ncbi:Chitin deacetylase [Grifola frondosa]|uniref:chitin deacetylase n=1 Tax=Grifola frondosa TaxID=5627 RepID=A0A1C7MQS4_GRIFR|nr:Chitin deacetylase [Grifola frondosa]
MTTYLDQVNLKTTFFVVGSRAISYPALLQDEYMAQHQIAVHTWSHPEMTTLTTDQLIAELGWSRKIIKDVTGVTPKYWRPPYGDVDDRVRAVAAALGLQNCVEQLENIIGNATTIDTGFIVLEHDLFQQTVDLATGYILPDALAHQPQFNIKPVIECLNLPLSDAYVETNDNATNPPLLGSNATASGSAGSAQGTGSSAAGNSKSGAVGIMVPNFITAAVALFATISAFLL